MFYSNFYLLNDFVEQIVQFQLFKIAKLIWATRPTGFPLNKKLSITILLKRISNFMQNFNSLDNSKNFYDFLP